MPATSRLGPAAHLGWTTAAGAAHRAGGFQRPLSAVAFGSGTALGVARVGACGGSRRRTGRRGTGFGRCWWRRAWRRRVRRPATVRRVGRWAGRPPGSAAPVAAKGVWLPGRVGRRRHPAVRAPIRRRSEDAVLGVARCERGSTGACGRVWSGWAMPRHPGARCRPGSAPCGVSPAEVHGDASPATAPGGGATVERLPAGRRSAGDRRGQPAAGRAGYDDAELHRVEGEHAGFGPLQERTSSARGLFVHAAVAFSDGTAGLSGGDVAAGPNRRPRET